MANESAPQEQQRSARLGIVASRQWGAVTHRQLREAGYAAGEIRVMVERGLLIRMHRGVYVLGALSPAPEQRYAAALLAGGRGAVLSHTAAASHFGWLQPREVIELSAPRKRRGDERLRIHERKRIEVTRRGGLPTTTPAQTLLDLAAQGWSIDRFTQEAAATGLVLLDELRAFAASKRGARGARQLAEAAGQPLVRSRIEWEAVKKLGVPSMNERIGGDEVDILIAVELDHPQTHGSKWARERDARKDQRLNERGIRVRRFTV